MARLPFRPVRRVAHQRHTRRLISQPILDGRHEEAEEIYRKELKERLINTAGYKICDIEKENGELALEIAAEGIVLLENSGALPFSRERCATTSLL